MRGTLGGLALLALALVGCVGVRMSQPTPGLAPITVVARPLSLDPADPARTQLGSFRYAGGLWLTSQDTPRLHGLSDLKVYRDGRFIAAGDRSDWLEGRLLLDKAGRLVGVGEARIGSLLDSDGVAMNTYILDLERDSEAIARLSNGDRIVAFEQNDRIWVWPAGGGPPRPAPLPDTKFEIFDGIEALALDPGRGADAYLVGIEKTGETFLCRLSGACKPDIRIDLEGLALTGFDILADGRIIYLLRGYSRSQGNTIRVRIATRQGRVIDGFELRRPLTVDNFEGVGVVPGPGGRLRIYIVTDDNFGVFEGVPTDQRTLLMAFDWSPPPK